MMCKILPAFGLMAALSAPLHAAQQDAAADPLAMTFAVCAGRFAALAEARFAPQGTHTADLRASSAHFSDLYTAIGPLPLDYSPPARALRAARVHAEVEVERLLLIAQNRTDPRRSRMANALIGQQILACGLQSGGVANMPNS